MGEREDEDESEAEEKGVGLQSRRQTASLARVLKIRR